jgi:hypothetical protein
LSATGVVSFASDDKISLSGVGATDQYFLGANYINANGTESVTTAARGSWRSVMRNATTLEYGIDWRAASAAASAFTRLLTVTSAGNVGIGTSSPSAQLHIANSNSNSSGTMRLAGSNRGGIIDFYNSNYNAARLTVDQSGIYTFSNSGFASSTLVDRMTLDTTGLAVTGNTKSTFPGSTGGSPGYGFWAQDSTDASGAGFAGFAKASGTVIGSITRVTTTDAVAYNTTSDGRLKENLRDFTDSGRLIDALKPRVFDWKNSDENGKNVIGFIAQEEHAADPIFAHIGAVSVGDEDPDTVTKQWQRSDSALIPILVAELKALRQRVAALESSN